MRFDYSTPRPFTFHGAYRPAARYPENIEQIKIQLRVLLTGFIPCRVPGVRHPEEKPAKVLEGKPNKRPLWAAFAAVNG